MHFYKSMPPSQPTDIELFRFLGPVLWPWVISVIKICSSASERFHNARPESFGNVRWIMPILFHPSACIAKTIIAEEISSRRKQSRNVEWKSAEKEADVIVCQRKVRIFKSQWLSVAWSTSPLRTLLKFWGSHHTCKWNQHKNTHMTFLGDQPIHLHWFTEKQALISNPTKSDHECP